jgi:hypothetical protein
MKDSGGGVARPKPREAPVRVPLCPSGSVDWIRCWASTQSAIVDRFGREQWHAFVAELQRLAECVTSIAVKFVPGETRDCAELRSGEKSFARP